MLTYRVDDMTCGHCASTITKAVRAADAGAKVEVDLAGHLVHIQPVEAGDQDLREAIAEAGYTPVPVEAQQAAATPGTGGCCCSGTGSSCRS